MKPLTYRIAMIICSFVLLFLVFVSAQASKGDQQPLTIESPPFNKSQLRNFLLAVKKNSDHPSALFPEKFATRAELFSSKGKLGIRKTQPEDQIVLIGTSGSKLTLQFKKGDNLRFTTDGWVDFLGSRFKNGSMAINADEIVFSQGTETLYKGAIYFFDGEKWTLKKLSSPTSNKKDNAFSICKVKGNKLKISADIPDELGNMQKGKGFFIANKLLIVDGKAVAMLPDEGIIWTPRVEQIGNFDLSDPNKLIDRPGFDFKTYKNDINVIPFKNGYAINLYGAELLKGGDVLPGKDSKCYFNKDGISLRGRLIREISAYESEDEKFKGVIKFMEGGGKEKPKKILEEIVF